MTARDQRILDALAARGSVQVNILAEELGVSSVTIRKDLRELEQRRLLHRTRGGARPPRRKGEGAFTERMHVDARAKRAIAVEAAGRVSDGDVIALDTSTTTHHLATQLLGRRGLVVVTSSLPTAMLFHTRSDARVVMPGGVLRRESAGLVGSMDNVLADRGRIMTTFVGTFGLSPTAGLMELSPEEAEAKKILIRAAAAVIGVFAATKITGFGLYPFAQPSELTELITDSAAGEEFVHEWAAVGVPVTRAPLDHPHDPTPGGRTTGASTSTTNSEGVPR
ncbi:DeoR/GlpR family DNA-binding transcription regulator [Ruania zhangjianzhongii]|uniref:DeoR/GlpR family DNA-binding transcription regulator n=1 Tax=Ruania zhangjianzhongii TaxID=2603206 RepID=UPI00143DB926|nr:DeoR/GlpR family DNA-binding transcription regulator [Ruania zhangjianzhongii]